MHKQNFLKLVKVNFERQVSGARKKGKNYRSKSWFGPKNSKITFSKNACSRHMRYFFFPGITIICATESFFLLVRVKVKKQVSEGRKKLIN